jgi:predicted AlkP superfamily phosphohydrolase/phosphomutase
MRNLVAVAALVALTLACAGAEKPQSTSAQPSLAHARRVVLISLDALAAGRNRENLKAGVYTDPDGLAAFEAGGYVVESAVPVDPPLTSPSHTSIATGAFPSVTGIVANWFHVPGTPILRGVSGFAAPWGAESLWQAFRRQGKRVGALGYVGCDHISPSRSADFGIVYVNTPNARAATVSLAAGQFAAATLPSGWRSYSPPRRTAISVPMSVSGVSTTATFTLEALDSSDDGATDYDTLVVDDDGDPANGTLATVHTGEWFPLRVRLPHRDGGTRTLGAWCLLRVLSPDLSRVEFYRGAFFFTEAYPREFREQLEATAGFWPGPGDDGALAKGLAGDGGLSLPEYMEQERRFSEFFSACARTAIAHQTFDLLLAYQPVVDDVEHRFLVVDPRQRAYSKAFASTARDAITEVYTIADHAVGELARGLDLSHDALVVVSDHGMLPVCEAVHVNQLLQHAGLAEAERTERGWRVKDTSKMVAFGSGGGLNLYVNLKGREPSGVVEPADMAAVLQAAAVALAQAQVDGQDVVEAMFRRDELAAIGMDSPNAGDLVVFLKPGFMGTSEIDPPGAPFHTPAEIAGQHGYLNTHPEMAAVWLARGAGVPRGHRTSASLTEVAAFVARIAGVQPPLQARPWKP